MLKRKKKNKQDIKYILDNLRKEDVLECETLHGKNWKEFELNEIMYTNSYVVMGVDKKDIPICVGGICETKKGQGIVWFLSTDEIKKHKLSILKEIKKEFEKFDKDFSFTYNLIYKKNSLAKNWLKWIGFKFDIPKPVGMNVPEDFEFFYRQREYKGLL